MHTNLDLVRTFHESRAANARPNRRSPRRFTIASLIRPSILGDGGGRADERFLAPAWRLRAS